MASSKMSRSYTRATFASDSKGGFGLLGGPIDIKALLDASTLAPVDAKKNASWTGILEGTINEEDIEQSEPVLFSNLIKKSKTETDEFIHPEVQFCAKFQGPYFKETPLIELSKKPGLVPINNFFHFESHRTRRDSDDDGLDEDDFTGIHGVVRKVKPIDRKESRRQSYIYEALRVRKGEFIFPHRTYRPKVQVAYRVPAGQVPQAVAIERLHRLYMKTDINVVCQNLGIELSDLIPPPHYGETNERFYQESMFRNRVKISGMDKREFIRTGGGKMAQEEHAEAKELEENANKPLLKEGTSSSSSSEVLTENSSTYSFDEEGEETDDGSAHPFIKLKPPFGAQFPLEFFDNDEFDIRSGEDWIRLGYDPKDKKMYPIPGKAFLPMPASQTRRFFPALSEVTSTNLLKKTEILERFRKWLVKERFRRQLASMGIEAKGGNLGATDNEMQLVARVTSTVPTLVKSGSGSTIEKDEERVSGEEQVQVKGSDATLASEFTLHETDTENETAVARKEGSSYELKQTMTWKQGSELPTAAPSGTDFDADAADDDDPEEYERIMAELTSKTPQGEAGKHPSQSEEEEDALKRSESLLEEMFSDPDAINVTPETGPRISAAIKAHDALEAGGRFSKRDTSTLKGIASTIAGGIIAPGSPDIDPFDDDGFERLVYEYNKMKKTHNYDWKWVDVAVFDYNPKTKMYFVRSIAAPLVFAWVSKIYLVFDGEDPTRHGQRIQDAIARRMEYEYVMRYNLYIDCLPVDKAPEMEPELKEDIIKRGAGKKKLSVGNQKAFERVLGEIVLEYKRTHMKLLFNSIVEKHPKLYKPWVHAPEEGHDESQESMLTLPEDVEPVSDWQVVHQRYLDCATQDFQYKAIQIKKASVIFKHEPYTVLKEIVANCLHASTKPLISTGLEGPLAIDKYNDEQASQLRNVVTFLRKEWIDSILDSIRTHLGKIPKSWYNLEESRWDVFELSKVSKFLRLIRFMAEDTLRHMVEDSLTKFVQEMQDLTAPCAHITGAYKWENDLKTSDFPSPQPKGPLFLLQLIMDNGGPKFTDSFSDFAKVLLEIFNACIDSSVGFLDIIQLVMKNLLFGTKDYLRTVNKAEPKINLLREELIRYFKRGFVPVQIYAQQYSRYKGLYNTNMDEFSQEWGKTNHSVKEVKAAIEHHKRHKREIENELPKFIDICAFRINVEGVRQALLAKKDEMINAVLDNFSKQLRAQCAQIKADYEEIEANLNHRPEFIEIVEELAELKEYHATLPPVIAEKDAMIHQIIQDYELFEKFKYPIPFEEFEEKWDLAMETCKIMKLYENLGEWLHQETRKILKIYENTGEGEWLGEDFERPRLPMLHDSDLSMLYDE